jgi:hypothetical protein
MAGGTPAYSSTAPDGSVKELSVGQGLAATFRTLSSGQGDLVWRSGCATAVHVTVSLDGAPLARLTTASPSWITTSFPAVVSSGRHTLSVTLTPSLNAGGCASVFVDRLDLIPRQPDERVLLGAALRASVLTSNPEYRQVFLSHFQSMTV